MILPYKQVLNQRKKTRVEDHMANIICSTLKNNNLVKSHSWKVIKVLIRRSHQRDFHSLREVTRFRLNLISKWMSITNIAQIRSISLDWRGRILIKDSRMRGCTLGYRLQEQILISITCQKTHTSHNKITLTTSVLLNNLFHH